MKTSFKAPIVINSPRFSAKSNPLKHICTPKFQAMTSDCFHPTFCAVPAKKTQFLEKILDFLFTNPKKIKEFDELMDFALTTTKKVPQKTQRKIKSLFKATAKLSNKKFINKGANNKVYRLSDKYVFKIPNRTFKLTFKEFSLEKSKIAKDLDIYFGTEVAKIGNATVLKNADPKKIALPIGAHYDEWATLKRTEKYYIKHKFAQKIEHMPQEAFDRVAMNFKKLNAMKSPEGKFLRFDFYNPNNFLIVGNKFAITDSLDKTSQPNANNIGGMLTSFVTQLNATVNAEPCAELTHHRKEIMKKCLLASEKAELPLSWDYYDAGLVKRAFELCEMEPKSNGLPAKFQEFRDTIPNIDERIVAVKNYIDSLK